MLKAVREAPDRAVMELSKGKEARVEVSVKVSKEKPPPRGKGARQEDSAKVSKEKPPPRGKVAKQEDNAKVNRGKSAVKRGKRGRAVKGKAAVKLIENRCRGLENNSAGKLVRNKDSAYETVLCANAATAQCPVCADLEKRSKSPKSLSMVFSYFKPIFQRREYH